MMGLGMAVSASAGDMTMESHAGLTVEQDDNPLLTAQRHDSSVQTRATVSMDMNYESETTKLALTPKLVSARDSRDQDLDYTAGYLDLNTAHQGESFSPSLRLNFTKDTTLNSEPSAVGVVQARHERRKWSADPSLLYEINEWANLQVGVGYQDVSYDVADGDRAVLGLNDYFQKTANLGLVSELGAKQNLNLSLAGFTLETPNTHQQTDYYSLTLRYDAELSQTSKLNMSVGGYKIDFNLPASAAKNPEDTGFTADFGMNERFEYLAGQVALNRELSPGYRGNLTRQDKATVSLGGGITESVMVNLGYSFLRVTELDALLSAQDRDYHTASLGMTWRAVEHWSTGLTYVYRDYRPENTALAAESNIVRWSVNYQ